ncbi:hypothetical protein G6F32_014614 [Rhizopus arrhizus]|nr:hypothetical protein G6F32_014614 [Rhizopus arrhizus]
MATAPRPNARRARRRPAPAGARNAWRAASRGTLPSLCSNAINRCHACSWSGCRARQWAHAVRSCSVTSSDHIWAIHAAAWRMMAGSMGRSGCARPVVPVMAVQPPAASCA